MSNQPTFSHQLSADSTNPYCIIKEGGALCLTTPPSRTPSTTHTCTQAYLTQRFIPTMPPCCLLLHSSHCCPLPWASISTHPGSTPSTRALPAYGFSSSLPILQGTCFNNQPSMFTDNNYTPGPALSANRALKNE